MESCFVILVFSWKLNEEPPQHSPDNFTMKDGNLPQKVNSHEIIYTYLQPEMYYQKENKQLKLQSGQYYITFIQPRREWRTELQ